MALPNTNIPIGAPPLLWSEVKDAFDKINENFIALDLATGGSAVNLETLNTSVSPAIDNEYTLGSSTNKWASVYTSDYSVTPGNELNGVWLGTAQIKGISGIVELPAGSKVNGDLIIDPDKTFFKSVQVDNGNQVVASSFSDILNLNSGTAMQLVVDSAAESVTFNNTGVTSAVAGSGISVSSGTGAVTISNAGVVSLSNSSTLPSGRTAGTGIAVSASTGSISITNTGLIGVQAGFGITISNDTATGISQISFNPTAAPQTGFTTIAVPTQTSLAADTTSDTLNINAGYGLVITTTESTDTLTFALNQSIDIKGSVFGDDSSTLVDGVNNYIYGNVSATTLRTSELAIALGAGAGAGTQGSEAIAIGMSAGTGTQGDYAVAIGSGAGNIDQGLRAVAIGATAGVDQGDYAISIGNNAGYPSAVANSIAINASGFTLDAPAAGFYVNPIRASTTSARPIVYDTTTKELKYTSTLEFINSTISTSDSSGITVDVITTFNSDIIVENDLTVAERLTVKGSRVINLAELKSVVAASTDFANFQARIAALV